MIESVVLYVTISSIQTPFSLVVTFIHFTTGNDDKNRRFVWYGRYGSIVWYRGKHVFFAHP